VFLCDPEQLSTAHETSISKKHTRIAGETEAVFRKDDLRFSSNALMCALVEILMIRFSAETSPGSARDYARAHFMDLVRVGLSARFFVEVESREPVSDAISTSSAWSDAFVVWISVSETELRRQLEIALEEMDAVGAGKVPSPRLLPALAAPSAMSTVAPLADTVDSGHVAPRAAAAVDSADGDAGAAAAAAASVGADSGRGSLAFEQSSSISASSASVTIDVADLIIRSRLRRLASLAGSDTSSLIEPDMGPPRRLSLSHLPARTRHMSVSHLPIDRLLSPSLSPHVPGRRPSAPALFLYPHSSSSGFPGVVSSPGRASAIGTPLPPSLLDSLGASVSNHSRYDLSLGRGVSPFTSLSSPLLPITPPPPLSLPPLVLTPRLELDSSLTTGSEAACNPDLAVCVSGDQTRRSCAPAETQKDPEP
jgi:hypothetical protein